MKHCSIPPQNRGHGTGVHEEKRAKSTPPLTEDVRVLSGSHVGTGGVTWLLGESRSTGCHVGTKGESRGY